IRCSSEERHAARDAGLRRGHSVGATRSSRVQSLPPSDHFCSGACDTTNALCTKSTKQSLITRRLRRMPSQAASAFTLITGANSGIGLELARQAAANGHNLILVAQDLPRLEAAADELRRTVSVHTIAQDLSQSSAAQTVYDQVRALGGEVDCLI